MEIQIARQLDFHLPTIYLFGVHYTGGAILL
jgi:hypothetical protein